MNQKELLKLAGQYFISDAGLSVANLIRKIQIAEGHVDCFATGKTRCDQMGCRWRKDCLPESAENASVEPEPTPSNKKWEITS
jgi:glycyl-tRNA synthetase (class II)